MCEEWVQNYHNSKYNKEGRISDNKSNITNLENSSVQPIKEQIEKNQSISLNSTLIKKINSTKSANEVRRKQIESMRKERTLNDSVFKNLEAQINFEESATLILLKKNQKLDEQLKRVDENFEKIKGKVEEFKGKDLDEIFLSEKESYRNQIQNAIQINKKSELLNVQKQNEVVIFDEHVSGEKPTVVNSEKNDQFRKKNSIRNKEVQILIDFNRKNSESKDNYIIKQILKFETVLKEFKIRTETNHIKFITEKFKETFEENEQLSEEFIKLEKVVP